MQSWQFKKGYSFICLFMDRVYRAQCRFGTQEVLEHLLIVDNKEFLLIHVSASFLVDAICQDIIDVIYFVYRSTPTKPQMSYLKTTKKCQLIMYFADDFFLVYQTLFVTFFLTCLFLKVASLNKK